MWYHVLTCLERLGRLSTVYVIVFFFILVFQSLAEFKILNMSIKVSFGWMLGSSKNVIDITLLRRIQLAVGTVAILEVRYWFST
jgi:hypothetical protein